MVRVHPGPPFPWFSKRGVGLNYQSDSILEHVENNRFLLNTVIVDENKSLPTQHSLYILLILHLITAETTT